MGAFGLILLAVQPFLEWSVPGAWYPVRFSPPASELVVTVPGMRYRIAEPVACLPILCHAEDFLIQFEHAARAAPIESQPVKVKLLDTAGARGARSGPAGLMPLAEGPLSHGLYESQLAGIPPREAVESHEGGPDILLLWQAIGSGHDRPTTEYTPAGWTSLLKPLPGQTDLSVNPDLYKRLRPAILPHATVRRIGVLGLVYAVAAIALWLLFRQRSGLLIVLALWGLACTAGLLSLQPRGSVAMEVENTVLDGYLLTALRGVAASRGKAVVEIRSSDNWPKPIYFAPGDWDSLPPAEMIVRSDRVALRLPLERGVSRAFEIWALRNLGRIAVDARSGLVVNNSSARLSNCEQKAGDQGTPLGDIGPGESRKLDPAVNRLTCTIETDLPLSISGTEQVDVRYIPSEIPITPRPSAGASRD